MRSQIGVGGLDEPLEEAVVKSGFDVSAVTADALLQRHQEGDAAALHPADLGIERGLGGLGFDL
jgi:hypothetical protein